MFRVATQLLSSLTVLAVLVCSATAEPADGTLQLQARSRAALDDGTFQVQVEQLQWDPHKTAIVVCDMWDRHWCRTATERVGQMAPRMNDVIGRARQQGVLIIHCPSGCMDKYADTPQRRLAQQAPQVDTKIPLQGWCHLDAQREAPLPIDDSDGGCDTDPPCRTHRAWTQQIDTIEIHEADAITDSAEAYYLMRQRGIENVIVMGVHTNMCVLGRPFSIRQMVYQGQNVVLMRDMTDSMYNPKLRPQVSHFRGTELVIEHIEKHWCPTVTSAAVLGGAAFRFPGDDRPHVVFVTNDNHYDSQRTLTDFAQRLQDRFGYYVTVLTEQGDHNIPGLEALDDADVMVLYARREALRREQMDKIRKYIDGGKPLVALRTASHAFSVREAIDDSLAQWPELDADVLGGSYHGHYSNDAGTDVTVVPELAAHPLLANLGAAAWHADSGLYTVAPVKDDATVLLLGKFGDKPAEPVAWFRTHHDGRVFYTSLGSPGDFAQQPFLTLLENAVHWAIDRPTPKPRGE